MSTFYPGPSKVYPQVEEYLHEAFHAGILSVNHRSATCMDLTRSVLTHLHRQLQIPEDYTIYFISSATEVWEIIAQSLTKKESLHCFNGAFGAKWYEYAGKLVEKVTALRFDVNQPLTQEEVNRLPTHCEPDVLCVTHNETANGTTVRDWTPLVAKFPEAIIAVDATSSLGGVNLPWQTADVWFASVQKCLGLPAGMAVMVCSPKALERAFDINDRSFYNSLLFIHENFQKFQTHYTPNVLGIFLLNKVMEHIDPITVIEKKVANRARAWYRFFEDSILPVTCLVSNPAVRSDTVITIQGSESSIAYIKAITEQHGITLGNGYGAWKNTTFRIANFPAISDLEIDELKEVLSSIATL